MAIDVIKNLNTKAPTNNRTAQTASDGAAKMMQQKAGSQGQAVSSGKVNVMGNLGAQQQEQQADAVVNQAAQAQQNMAQAESNINEQQEFQERVLSDQELAQQNAYSLQTQTLYDNYARSMQSLDSDRADMNAKMLATNMRLQNQKYMDELDLIARREGLNDSIKFAEKATKIARGRDLDLLGDQLDWNRISSMKEIDFKESLGNEDIESALAIGLSQADDSRTRQNMGNIGTTFGSIAGAKSSYDAGVVNEASDLDRKNRQAFEDQQSGYDPNTKYTS